MILKLNVKRTASVVALYLTLGLVSCDDSTQPNPFLGTWKFAHETHKHCDDPADDSDYDIACNASQCAKLIFQEEGKFIYETTVGGKITNTNGTYSFSGSQVTLCTTGCDSPMIFLVTGSVLTLIREDLAGCTVISTLDKES